jgi:hypothetical protein
MVGQGVTSTIPPQVIHVVVGLLLTLPWYHHLPATQVGLTIASSLL